MQGKGKLRKFNEASFMHLHTIMRKIAMHNMFRFIPFIYELKGTFKKPLRWVIMSFYLQCILMNVERHTTNYPTMNVKSSKGTVS